MPSQDPPADALLDEVPARSLAGMAETFDYIVAGGGTAGCVIAARLPEDPDTRVLLLEAGAAEPAPAMSDPLAWPGLAGTSVDWAYQTVPQAGTGGAVHRWPRGKVLGGSSGINAMMHARGDRSSYDAREAAGATGWNYQALLPFFKRSERVAGGDPRYRGLDGPMLIDTAPPRDPLREACFQAAVEAGCPPGPDGNGASAEGTSWNDMNVVDGAGQSAAEAYLRPVIARPNLTVAAGARVRRLIIERGRCRGVEYVADGSLQATSAGREVILAAGAIGTPRLLLLPGAGPARHLRGPGLGVAADIPGVGENLHDHPFRDKELFPGPAAQADAALRDYLARSLSTYFHPAGTCKIGTGAMSVADAELRVHEVDGQRIADASVMPSPVSGNTNATVLAIAERAACMLM